jgi:elongation factor Ts
METQMADISAKLVNDLRSRTGQAMMECKKALVECGGDMDKAIDFFRKKGVKASLSERTATEGRIIGAQSADKKSAALVEINTNTDFTAKSEPVQKVGAAAAQLLLKNPGANVAEESSVKGELTIVAQTTGENVQIGKTAALANPAGTVGLYLYGITGKIGVIMSFSGGTPGDDLVKQIGGHIAFAKPVGLTREEVPADLVAKEKEMAVEQAKATGKPQQIAEKIAEGKMNAFFAERVLLDQEFFNSQVFKGNVTNYLKQNGVELIQYARIEVGA